MSKLLAVFVGQGSAENLRVGLENGIWGFNDHGKPDDLNLEIGDFILLASGYSGGSPRTDLENWLQGQLNRLVVGRLTRGYYESTDPVWPDEAEMQPEERYKHRVEFDAAGEFRGVALAEESNISRELADAVRRSGCSAGKGFVLQITELPIFSEDQGTGTDDPAEAFDSDELFAVLQRYEAETILFQSSEGGAGYSVEKDGPKYSVNRLDAFEHESISRQAYLNHRGKLQEHGGRMRFTEFNGTAAIRNCILQAPPLALSPDRKEIIDISDPEKRIELFCDILRQLKVDRSRDEPKLYKPAMVACVIEAIEEGELSENKIPFDWIAPRFIAKMAELGDGVGNEQAAQAFCHLKGDMIWLHAVVNPRDPMKDGREGPSAAREKVKYALIKDTFWECLQSKTNRQRAMNALSEEWFKDESPKRFWMEKTLVSTRQDRQTGDHSMGKALWSPQRDAGNRDIYATMREVQEGDIVLHLVDNRQIFGASIAASVADDTFQGIAGTNWEGPGYRIQLKEYVELPHPIQRAEFFDDPKYRGAMLAIRSKHSGLFYNKDLDLNQGSYLTSLPPELAALFNSIHIEATGSPIPHFPTDLLYNGDDLMQSEVDPLTPEFPGKAAIALTATGLIFDPEFVRRFLFSLLAKPFVILTGTSGTGKTQLALKFAQWLTGKDGYELVAVGADWTDNRQVLGQYNPFQETFDSTRVLDLLLRARENRDQPHFLILDEMNLSHVERYFADFLSGIESGDEISLHRNGDGVKTANKILVPEQISIPENLFIVGTVNVDETTYMFSPKVLDRANVLEFSVSAEGLQRFLESDSGQIRSTMGKGQAFAPGFLEHAKQARSDGFDSWNSHEARADLQRTLLDLFSLLAESGMEFAFRTASEIDRYSEVAFSLAEDPDSWDSIHVMDAQILQKILPKLHGSRRKIEPLLAGLCQYCANSDLEAAQKLIHRSNEALQPPLEESEPKFPMSYHKLIQMILAVRRDQFVSFIQ